MASVCIIQRVLPHYRVALFEHLERELRNRDILLTLIYGQERPGTVPKSEDLKFEWARRIRNQYFSFGEREVVWQPCLAELPPAKLLIVEQANRLLVNHVLFGRRWLSKSVRLAYWGHGRNLQSGPRLTARERLKRAFIDKVDWWFAYTELTANIVTEGGYPRERISILENSIDTKELEQALRTTPSAEVEALRMQLGMSTKRVAIYCGGMYADKRLDFLVEACQLIRSKLPDFEMLFGVGRNSGRLNVRCGATPGCTMLAPTLGRREQSISNSPRCS